MLSGPVRQEAREQRLPVGGVMRWAKMAAPWPSPHIQAWAGAAPGAGVLGLKRGPPRRRCGSPALPVARPLAKGDLAHAPRPGPRLSSRFPVSAPGPFSLLPERRALSHLRLPARPPRSARPAAGPDPPFRSRHTNLPLKEETLRHATSVTPRMPSCTCHYLKSSCSFLSPPEVGEGRAGTAVWRPTLHPPCPEQDRARGGAQ